MNCIIIDDEPLARIGMEDLIAGNEHLVLLKSFKNAEGVSSYLKDNNVNLIFLDIEMPGTNGLEFATMVPEETLIIFTTAYSQYALESYEVDAIDYLVKPLQTERFNKAVAKAISYSELLKASKASLEDITDDHIMIRADRRNHNILYKEITYIEALKDYVIIYTKTSRYITWMNLKTIYSKLPQVKFLRVSKSYIVNIQEITSFDNTSVTINNIEISIGKAYSETFFQKYTPKK